MFYKTVMNINIQLLNQRNDINGNCMTSPRFLCSVCYNYVYKYNLVKGFCNKDTRMQEIEFLVEEWRPFGGTNITDLKESREQKE